MEYVRGPLLMTFFVLQFGVGSLVPLTVLSYLIWRGTTGRALIVGVTASAALVLFAVLMMRWNVVIGGQEIAKTGKGLVNYQPTIGGREGLLAAAALIAMPFVLLWAAVRLFPPWQNAQVPTPVGPSP